ncbi:hypothetical protein [Shimazuella alba]|uniref:Uncharacterized protein n=1 Tax=Shimazuella alba TaxID=2690964 RepID=A0A6I4VS18_9BACL|nr:hypothetical protein [Shimazuella alba]MXQ54377.1 hypothetical protein [Shimazuella alba]
MSNDYFEELAKLASDLSKRTSQLDEMMQALYNVNLSIGDQDKLMKLINHMAKFNKQKPNESKPSNATSPPSPTTSTPAINEQKGDFMYDLFNSPAMMSIIKEHYGKKKKK